MSEKSRELSQFGSFLLVDNVSGNISISTETTPNIGIGTTNPQYKLDVRGDTNISGIINATGFYVTGQGELINPISDKWSYSGNDIYRLNDNVGIGTSSLTNKFEVNGNSNFDGNINITGILTSSNINAATFNSTVGTGTAPFTVNSTTVVTNLNANLLSGKSAPTGSIVGTTDGQLLQAKELEDISTLFVDNANNTKKFRFEISGISENTTRIITIPNVSGTVILQGQENVITSSMITDLEIVNSDIAVSAGISYTKLNLNNSIVNADIQNSTIQNAKLVNGTISNVSLGSTLNNLLVGSYLNFSSGSNYNGSTQRTVSVAATSTNTINQIVARDSNGNFAAGNITATQFTIVGGNSNQFLKANGSTDSTSYISYSRSVAYSILFN